MRSKFDVPNNPFMQVYSRGDKEFVDLLSDRSAVFRRLDQLAIAAACVHGALSGSGGRLPRPDFSVLEILAAAGEERRLLVDTKLARNELVADKASGRHLEVRVYRRPFRCMLVFDDRRAIVPIDEANWDAGALLLRAPLAVPCGQLFDFLWSESYPLSNEAGRGDGLSSRQLEVARLLIQGDTDNQVADYLGVSSRTVRNVVSELQQRFGTTSRMALGFQLGQAGTFAADYVERDERPGRGSADDGDGGSG